jgi:hypothetical protein
VLCPAKQLPVLAQQPRTYRVERRGHDAPRTSLAKQVGESQSQLAGGTDTEM